MPTKIKRTMTLINKNISIKFGLVCFNKQYIDNKKYIKPIIDILMEEYLTGVFDRYLERIGSIDHPLKGEKMYVQLPRSLKSEFENRAWARGIIPHPCHGAWLIEMLMFEFNEGNLDGYLSKNEKLKIKKNRYEKIRRNNERVNSSI